MLAAIIPARGGSKRIPGKNLKPFVGRPILEYSIEAAGQAGIFDRIIVSTDSPEIALLARQAGAEVPFERPANLADDFTPTAEVLVHALRWLNDQEPDVEAICCIYPTAPMVRASDLVAGLEKMRKNKVSAVIAVTTFDFPIFRAMRINKHGTLEMFWPEHEMTRSNDLPQALHDAGQFYWLDAEKFSSNPVIYAEDALPLMIERHRVQDIDTPEDWQRAESLFLAERRAAQKQPKE